MKRKLLLADDSITMQKLVEVILAEEGFDITATNNGEDALALIPSFQPDIILADANMPNMNGYQLSEKIKHDPSMSTIPVILLTGAFEPIDKERLHQVKADDFIIKPFEPQELIQKIHIVLKDTVEVVEKETKSEPVGSDEILFNEGGEKTTPDVNFPSKEEFKKIFEQVVRERIDSFFAFLDIKEDFTKSLLPLIKDSVEKINQDIVPGLAERFLKENISKSIESLTKEFEKAIWETIPDLAEMMISKEIERIRSEF